MLTCYIICLHPNRDELLKTTPLLQLDPAEAGVFGGPYPFGIDPVRALPSSAVLQEHPVCKHKSVCSNHCESFPHPSKGCLK